MHEAKVSVQKTTAVPTQRSGRLGADSLLWLVAVSVLFLLSELTSPGLLHMPLGSDEITYIARTSIHASGVTLPPVHGQGAGLLAAPVTLLTTSLVALRAWMAVLSAAAFFLSLLCWRGLRPAWVLALAGLIFGGLAISQNSGVQVYPDWWSGLGLLALTGLFLQVMRGGRRPGLLLSLIGFTTFVIVLMRPQNIVFILGPTIVAALVVPAWRKPRVLIAMAAGVVLGLAQWVAGAYIWFGGLANRIRLAGQEPPTLGFHVSFIRQVKVLSGPWYCDTPSSCGSWNLPGETVWWAALLGFAILGVYAVWRRPERLSSLLAAFSALWVLLFYSLLVPFGAPRYLIPTFALMAILAADAIAWLGTKARWRTAGIVVSCVFVLSGVASQQLVLQREIHDQTAGRATFVADGRRLIALGVRPPCVMGTPFVGYYVGCYGPWTGQTWQQLLASTPQGLHGWRRLHRPGLKDLVYVPK